MTSRFNFVATTERASISAEGDISSFQKVKTSLVTKRSGLAGFRIDDYFYVAGGLAAEASSKVPIAGLERAAIGPDGGIGSFEAVTPALSTSRYYHGVVTLAEYVYFPGGYAGRVFLTAVERGTLGAADDLSGFVADGVSKLAESYVGGAVVQVSDKAVYYIGGYSPSTCGQSKVQKALIRKETIQ
jgi:hypothetical protein